MSVEHWFEFRVGASVLGTGHLMKRRLDPHIVSLVLREQRSLDSFYSLP